MAHHWLDWLCQQPGVQRVEMAGSLRRWQPTIGSVDLVVASDQPEKVLAAFAAHPEVRSMQRIDGHTCRLEMDGGARVQLCVDVPERFGSRLQFFTGSKQHNQRLSQLASRRGLSLGARGLSGARGEVTCTSEEEVYAALDLPYIPPELREDGHEIDVALSGALPHLIECGDLVADLHCHTTWSDGSGTILDMAEKARALGLKVLAITDHSCLLTVEKWRQQAEYIREARRKLGKSLRLLHGIEVDISEDGELDFPAEALAEMDVVVASLHDHLTQPRHQITRRLLRAMQNPLVDIIAHPTGRLLFELPAADLDWDEVLPAARRSGVALEINSNPLRLDLDEVHARQAVELGIPLTIDTDSHRSEQLERSKYGVSVARRAWLEAPAVLSTWGEERLMKWLRQRRAARSLSC